MPQAFVLINAELGAENTIIKELKNTENVSEVYIVYGAYDIVVKIEADTMEKVKETSTTIAKIFFIISFFFFFMVFGNT